MNKAIHSDNRNRQLSPIIRLKKSSVYLDKT